MGIRKAVAAAVSGKNLIAAALGAKFYGSYSVFFEHAEHLFINGVRPGAYAYAGKSFSVYPFFCRSQKAYHKFPWNHGKTAAEKRNFAFFRKAMELPCGFFKGFINFFRGGHAVFSGDGVLIAERAPVRAPDHGNKKCYVCVFHSPISSSASFAAICSADFLLLPMP